MKVKKKFINMFASLKKTYEFAKKDKKYLIYFLIGSILYCTISVVAPLLSAKRIVSLTAKYGISLFLLLLLFFLLNF